MFGKPSGYVLTLNGEHLHLPADWFTTVCGRESAGGAPADSAATLCRTCKDVDYQREFRAFGPWVSLPCSVGKCDLCLGRDCEHGCSHTVRNNRLYSWPVTIFCNAGGMLLALVLVLGVFG